MNRSRILLCVSALMAAMPLLPAQAAVITVSETLDLTQSGLASSGFTYTQDIPPFDTSFFVSIALGDSFDYTIDFKGAQSLTLVNPSLSWGYAYATTSTQVTGTGTLSLLDASGNAFLVSDPKTDTEGDAHFGQQFGPGDFAGGLPSTLTFYGLRYVGVVDGYADGSTTRDYYSPALALDADRIGIDGAIPEPASWAMMAGGFGLVGGAIRRRRRTGVAFA